MLGYHRYKKQSGETEPAASDASANAAMTPTPHAQVQGLGEALVAHGVISQAQLDQALAIQQKQGGFVGQIVVDLDHVKQDAIVSFLVKECKIPHLSLLDYDVSDDLMHLIPMEFCLEHHLLPIDKLGKILTVAMVDPLDSATLDQVRELCPDLRIKPILCNWRHFETVAHKLFGVQAGVSNEVTADSLGLPKLRTAPKAPSPSESPEGAEEAAPEALDEVVAHLAAGAAETAAAAAGPEVPPQPRGHVAVPGDATGPETSAAPVEEAPSAAIREPEAPPPRRPEGGEGRGVEDAAAAPLVAAVREAVREASENLLRAVPSLHLAQAESAAVREAAMRDLVEAGEKRQRVQHASVRPFRPDRGALGPEMQEDDRHVMDAMASETPLAGFTFETFYAGKVNEFTYKLGQAVSANPGGEYNPFFLYGNVGLGKTHLINAIGNAICESSHNRRVGYVSASHFARRLAEALQGHALEMFRQNYCHWDVLILDDIQFMGGRIEAQEEFFHIFNVLHQEGRQIIIAGDKAPEKLGLLEQRLVSRFAGGIVAELRPPEMATRLAILRHLLNEAKADIPEEIISVIAMRVPNDMRMMVGALRKIIAFDKLIDQKITYEMANEILSHLGVVEAA